MNIGIASLVATVLPSRAGLADPETFLELRSTGRAADSDTLVVDPAGLAAGTYRVLLWTDAFAAGQPVLEVDVGTDEVPADRFLVVLGGPAGAGGDSSGPGGVAGGGGGSGGLAAIALEATTGATAKTSLVTKGFASTAPDNGVSIGLGGAGGIFGSVGAPATSTTALTGAGAVLHAQYGAGGGGGGAFFGSARAGGAGEGFIGSAGGASGPGGGQVGGGGGGGAGTGVAGGAGVNAGPGGAGGTLGAATVLTATGSAILAMCELAFEAELLTRPLCGGGGGGGVDFPGGVGPRGGGAGGGAGGTAGGVAGEVGGGGGGAGCLAGASGVGGLGGPAPLMVAYRAA